MDDCVNYNCTYVCKMLLNTDFNFCQMENAHCLLHIDVLKWENNIYWCIDFIVALASVLHFSCKCILYVTLCSDSQFFYGHCVKMCNLGNLTGTTCLWLMLPPFQSKHQQSKRHCGEMRLSI